MKKLQGFTLIELLVVVAIIGILAAIAVPAYRAMHLKSMAARAIADLNVIATALEVYKVDNNAWPPSSDVAGVPLENYSWPPEKAELEWLVPKYLSILPLDPFQPEIQWGAGHKYAYAYAAEKGLWGEIAIAAKMKEAGRNYLVISVGPDHDGDMDRYRMDFSLLTPQRLERMNRRDDETFYAPTNGLFSSGDIPRIQGMSLPEL